MKTSRWRKGPFGSSASRKAKRSARAFARSGKKKSIGIMRTASGGYCAI